MIPVIILLVFISYFVIFCRNPPFNGMEISTLNATKYHKIIIQNKKGNEFEKYCKNDFWAEVLQNITKKINPKEKISKQILDKVKEEYIDKLPSITHIDNTARLQTVTEKSHKHFYELLTEFGKISDTNVLLNTSFNIRGYPILSTIEDALYALENTEMDYVVIEDYLFEKQ